ncbi:MAG: GNAT family N-acetyltransferase [Bacteroidota bacterium]
MSEITIRKGTVEDMPAVHALIRELALYEKELDAVETSPEIFAQDGFGERPYFECFVADHTSDGVVGVCLFYFAYSTWKGKMIYLDDLIITESHRRQGIGHMLLQKLATYGHENDAALVRWQVLDWNEPAINMYKKIGAEIDETWYNCTIRRDKMANW